MQCSHNAHHGADSCIKRAKDLNKCKICDREAHGQQREPLQRSGTAKKALLQSQCGYIMALDGHGYLIAVDNLSGCPEVDKLRKQTSSEVISKLRMIFARFG